MNLIVDSQPFVSILHIKQIAQKHLGSAKYGVKSTIRGPNHFGWIEGDSQIKSHLGIEKKVSKRKRILCPIKSAMNMKIDLQVGKTQI